MVDDFYLNLLSWSCQNAVAVALEASTYIRPGAVVQLGECPEATYLSSVDFSNDGAFLGVGNGNSGAVGCGNEPGVAINEWTKVRLRGSPRITMSL